MGRSPKAEVEVTASSRSLAAKLREARSKFANFGQELRKNVFGKDLVEKGFLGKAGAQMVGNLGARAVSGLGEMAVDQGKEVFAFNDALTRFGIAARKTPEEMQDIAKSVREVSSATGLSAREVLGAGRAYIDLAGAGAYTTDMMSLIARAAQASGTEINDLTTVVYALHQSLKIPDNEMEATLSGLINQSKDGTVHFNQLAQEIIGIAPAFARFGVTGREGANELAAMFQVIRGGFKDPAQAATAMLAVFRGLGLHADKFAKFGVHVFETGPDGVKRYAQIGKIIDEIEHSELAKDPHLLMKSFGRGEGQQAYQLLVEGAAKLKEFEESAKASDTIQKDLATYSGSAAGRMSIAWEKAKNTIAEAFTPERIDRFVGAMERLIPMLSKMATFISNAASAIDMIINGPGKEAGGNMAAGDFAKGANTGDEKDRAAMIAEAQKAINFDPKSAEGIAYAMANKDKFAYYGGLEGYQAGARKYLASEGRDAWEPKYQSKEKMAATAAAVAAATPEQKIEAAKQTGAIIAASIVQALGPLLPRLEKAAKAPIAVKVGSDAIVTAHREAPTHRTRPGG